MISSFNIDQGNHTPVTLSVKKNGADFSPKSQIKQTPPKILQRSDFLTPRPTKWQHPLDFLAFFKKPLPFLGQEGYI